MHPSQTRKRHAAFEFFLYAGMIAETGLAAIVYKFIFQSGDFVRFRVYFAIFYFGFLAWDVTQLNRLHRYRKQIEDEGPEIAPAENGAGEDSRPVLGLTGSQLVIVAVVFGTAIAAFSWALHLIG